MAPTYWMMVLLGSSLLFAGDSQASRTGHADPVYKSCVNLCKTTGCVEDQCFPTCSELTSSPDVNATMNSYFQFQVPMFGKWKQWVCQSDCRYHCMVNREKEKGQRPVKYHGKWPSSQRSYLGVQEPVSLALSTLNLAINFHGWLTFLLMLNYKLPLRPSGQTYYRFSGIWHAYGVLAINFWFWSSAFHGRYVELTERLYYSSSVVLTGYSLISCIIRAFDLLAEATRVMVAAPLIGFAVTHLLYLNVIDLDYAWNTVVVASMVTSRILFLVLWAARSNQPSCWKLWMLIVGGSVAVTLEVFDFPPYKGVVDAYAVWQAISIPLSYLWWSIIRDDAEFTTLTLIKKAK